MARQKKQESEKCIKMSISFEPDQYKRLMEYCEQEERAVSWVVRKALDKWLKEHS